MKQLGLFGSDPKAPEDAAAPPGPVSDGGLTELMERVPAQIRFGPSSWSFPGWNGIVWQGAPTEKQLAKDGLGWLSRYPLFRTVGIDRSYYAPLGVDTLRRYASQLAPGFRCVSKAPATVTQMVLPRSREANPLFLDPHWFVTEVLAPYAAVFQAHTGPIVLELSPLRRTELPDVSWLAEKLDVFFDALPPGFQFAVEFRNWELVVPAVRSVLKRHGVARVLNYWERMPPLGDQMRFSLEAKDFAVTRLMLPPGQRYAERKKSLGPFSAVSDPQPGMRDDVLRLVRECLGTQRDLFIIANNKAEGCSPLTLRALAERVAEEFGQSVLGDRG